MSASITFSSTIHTQRIQILVMKYGGWFECNPLELFNQKSRFVIAVDNNMRKSNSCVTILKQPWI